jgi:hypothetical protein
LNNGNNLNPAAFYSGLNNLSLAGLCGVNNLQGIGINT